MLSHHIHFIDWRPARQQSPVQLLQVHKRNTGNRQTQQTGPATGDQGDHRIMCRHIGNRLVHAQRGRLPVLIWHRVCRLNDLNHRCIHLVPTPGHHKTLQRLPAIYSGLKCPGHRSSRLSSTKHPHPLTLRRHVGQPGCYLRTPCKPNRLIRLRCMHTNVKNLYQQVSVKFFIRRHEKSLKIKNQLTSDVSNHVSTARHELQHPDRHPIFI